MDKENKTDWEKARNILFQIFMLSLIVLGSFYIGVVKGEEKRQEIIFMNLKDNLQDKNLKLIDEQNFIGKWQSDYDFETFKNYVLRNYNYSDNLQDCKYWSLEWATYLEKHYIDYKFVETDNHIFVVTYDDKGYCVLDLNYTLCRGMELK